MNQLTANAIDILVARRVRSFDPFMFETLPVIRRGYCYFIQDIDGGPIKIGVASNPRWRLAELQIGNPNELEIIALASNGHRPTTLENDLHKALSDWRLRGEWFLPVPPVLDVVRWLSERAR